MRHGAENRGLQLSRQRDRQNERERGPLAPNLPLEGRAAGAAVDVGACDAPGQDAATHRCQPLAAPRARMLPRPPSTDEPFTCLEYQRLDLLLSDPEHGGDFLVRVIGELKQNERRALVGGQPLQVVHQLAKVLPPLDLICHPHERGPICRRGVDVEIASGAELGQAAVPRDRIQPGSERDVALGSSQGAKRRDERHLKRVLSGLAVSEHVHAEREHAASVSIVDRLERSVVARAQTGHQILVIFGHDGAATEPTAEPGYCRVHPHAHSVRYPAPKVQRNMSFVKPIGDLLSRRFDPRSTSRVRLPGVGQTASRESVIPGRRAPNRLRQTEKK